ncbi:MAG: MYXO-CTERM sorting domain-containing protein [Myxococcales bacterium]
MNQLANHSFEDPASTAWTPELPTSGLQPGRFEVINIFAPDGMHAFLASWNATANNQTSATLSQTFQVPTAARASMRAAYMTFKTGNVTDLVFKILVKRGSTVVFSQELPADGDWATAESAPFDLEANTPYTFAVQWELDLKKDATVNTYIDDIRVSLAPSGLSASPHLTETHAQLNWSPSTGTAPALASTQAYAIYRGTAPGSLSQIDHSDTNSFVDTGAAANTTYYYAVSDIDVSGQESPLSAESNPVLTRPAAPGAPTIVSATAQQIVVSWTRPEGGSGPLAYKVYRASVEGGTVGSFTPVGSELTDLQYADSTVACGSTYRYQVRARNGSGEGVAAESPEVQTSACTTTVGNGNDAGTGGSACPGAANGIVVDKFTLRTNNGTDTVRSISVALTDHQPVRLVEILSGGSAVGSAEPTSTSVAIDVNLSASLQEQTYEIRLSPRGHLEMPESSFTVGAHVSGIDHDYDQAVIEDSPGNALVIDNLPPSGTWGSSQAGDARVDLAWTKSETGATSIVLRSTTLAALTQIELEDGQLPPSFGNDVTVVYVGTNQSKADTSVVNGTDYYYKLFVGDGCSNYSTGAITGPLTPRGTNTVADAANEPPGGDACPGDTTPVAVDRFRLSASNGSDRIESVRVTLSPQDSYLAVGLVEITSADGQTVYGSAIPSGDEVVVSVGAPSHPDLIARDGPPVPYLIRLAPRPPSAMPAPPGQIHTIGATVTGLDCFNDTQINDRNSAALTIDNESPAAASWTTVTPDDASVLLNWQGSTGASGYLVVRSESALGPNDKPAEGVAYDDNDSLPGRPDAKVVYAGSGTSHPDTTAVNNTTYLYTLFAYDACHNYSPATASTPQTPTRTILTIGDASIPEPNDGDVLCPEPIASTFDVNAFTLQRSRGSEEISEMVIELSEGSAEGIKELEIFCGSTRNGFASPTGDELSLTLTRPISVEHEQPVECLIRVTPKALAEMPAPPGAFYAIQARVTEVTTNAQVEANDATSGTLRVDNESPSPSLWDTVIPGNATLDLTWTNGEGTERVLVLRTTVENADDVPAEGEVYGLDTQLGDSTVVHFGQGTSAKNIGLLNGREYWFTVFGLDECRNYSVGTRTGPHSPGEATNIVGDGVDPQDSTACPGDAALMLDTFTVATTLGIDSLKGVTVELSEGAGSVLSLVEIVSEDGATVYGSKDGTIGDSVNVVLQTPVSFGTEPKTLAIRVTPKSHAEMPAVPGATVSVTGRVRSIDSKNTATGRDTNSATIAIDNGSPAAPQWKPAVESGAELQLAWTNPEDSDLAGVLLVRGSAEPADVPDEGAEYAAGDTVGSSKALAFGDLATYTDSAQGLDKVVYRLFARDTCGNYSAPAELEPRKPSTDGGVDVPPGPELGAYDIGGCGCGMGGAPMLATGLLAALGLLAMPRRRRR